ncbi:hypothetical protein [Novosphingobium rosa]|uniref:hypothetical protein n=1 Tax=Novosphingobium rosa TaxID=76978 RepID=UPI0008347C1B|nr:hypothetical protein [Novosphingobium rosa]
MSQANDRSSIIMTLLMMGAPRADAEQAVDLGYQARDAAVKAIEAIFDQASPQVRRGAEIIGTQLLANAMNARYRRIQAIAIKNGVPIAGVFQSEVQADG